MNGDSVLVKAQSNDHGRVNLAVTVPKSARVTINSGGTTSPLPAWAPEST